MKAELLSNLRELVHLKIQDRQRKTKYQYIPPRPAKWYRKAKPACLWDGYFTVELPDRDWLQENHYILDEQNIIWSKPIMYIWFSDGSKPLEYVFNTYEEAVLYRDKILAEGKEVGLVLTDLQKCQ